MNSQITGLVTPLTALVFATVFGLLWWRGRMGDHLIGFALAYLFFGAGFASTHALDPTSFYIFHVTQLLYAMGTFCVIWGAAKRVGQRPPVTAVLITYAIAAATLAVAVGVTSDVAPRLYIVNTGYGAMFVIATLTLLQSRRRDTFDKLVIFVFALSAANFFVRPVLTLLVEQNIPAAAYRDSVYYSVLSLSLTVMSVVVAATLIGACVADLMGSMREGANRDGLTGMRNRQTFEAKIRERFEAAKRRNVPVSLVVADIDHFKQVNDLWGHQAGDNAITRFGNLIEDQVRDTDIAGRIGGEEFCVFVWDCDEEAAHGLADRIRKAFATQQFEGLPEHIRLTASFGVSRWQHGERYAQVFGRADAALYAAKEGGRDLVVSSTAVDGPRDELETAAAPVAEIRAHAA